MKCPNCSHDMTSSGSGWLCLNCGHIHSDTNKALDAAQPPRPISPPPIPLSQPVPAAPVVPPPIPPIAPAPLNPPVSPPTPRRLNRKKLSLITGLVVLLLLLSAGAVYGFVVAPRLALAGYLQRLAGAKTSTYASSMSFQSNEGYKFALKLAGSNDLTDIAKPKLDVKITGQLSTQGGVVMPGEASQGGSLNGQLRLIAQTVYFKIQSFSLLSNFFPIEISKDWYKYKLESGEDARKCVQGKDAILTEVPVKQAAFKGLDTINGAKMLHYTGTIHNAKLQKAIDNANKKLSADCKLDISADDYKTVSVTYHVWHGWNKDRVQFNIVDSKAKTTVQATIDSGGYNQPVKIEVPSGAKDFEQLLKEMMNNYGNSPQYEAVDSPLPAT